MFKNLGRRRPVKVDDITDDLEAEVDDTTLARIDDAQVVSMPQDIDELWVGKELDERAEEQVSLWHAKGEEAARRARVTACGLTPAATALNELSERQTDVAAVTGGYYLRTLKVLSKYTRRPPQAKFWYILRWVGLVLGDIAGISGAAILLGEIVSLAVMQAVAAGIAAVTAGVIGEDVRDIVLARRRRREPESLTDEEKEFAHLLTGVHGGENIIKIMVCVAATIALLTAGGIFALRSGVEGTSNGVIFACLALAVCLASVLNTYLYADEVADQIDSARHTHRRERRDHRKLSKRRELRRYAKATAESESLTAEHELRARAAYHRVLALKWRVHRQNPGVAGHGPSKERDAGVEREIPLQSTRRNGIRSARAGD